eukprot:TRINITY_DN541_c0_g1_i1.p2 TRINITY_DN541_c0_g1~~TRINITY_DN541_c0_g1_i1.p2  ORF type:complete len:141 (+),score=7.40 TRINITY_DN541_c0_g1_i1:226-648(+)
MAPTLELAMLMMDGYSQESGLQIVGCYHGSDVDHVDVEVSPAILQLAEKISSYFSDACLAVIHNALIPTNSCALQPHIKSGNKWVSASDMPIRNEGNRPLILKLIATQSERSLQDFEDHLNDITLDWRNPTLFASLKKDD